MNIEQWNQLRTGDMIQIKGVPHKVHTLGKDTFDVEQDGLGNDIRIRSHNLWLDPLLPPDDPWFPDITLYEPGEAYLFDRIDL